MRSPRSLAGWLRALRDGHVTFERFYTGTHADWERMGGRLMSRWQVPTGVELQDVVQELIIGAWSCLPKYDPTRGVTLARFCVYNSMDRAKRWMHQQRNALRRSDRNPGRFPSTGWVAGDGKRPLEDLLRDPSPLPDEAVELNRISSLLRRRLAPELLVEQLVAEFEGLDALAAEQIVKEAKNPRGRSQS